MYSYLAYLEQEEIEQFIGLLDKEDSDIQESLDAENYNEFKLLEQGLREIKDHNSPGTIVHSVDIFPFWAKMKTVITASCDDFCKNFRSRNQVHDV